VAAASERLRVSLGLAWYGVSDEVRTRAAREGLVVCGDPARLLHGAGLLRRGRLALAAAPGRPAGTDSAAAPRDLVTPGRGSLVPARVGDGRSAVDEAQVMDLLEECGLTAPRRRPAPTVEEAVRAAAEVGHPCVLKLLDPLLPHRAKAGAVRTGLTDEAAVRSAMGDLVRDHGARTVLVVEQLDLSDGVEVITGVVADPVFGTRALLGSGGVDAEDAGDARTLVPPYDAPSVRHALEDLRATARIRRVRPDVDGLAGELAALLHTLASLVTDPAAPRITEVECNPVLVRAEDAVVLDALAFVETEEEVTS
jgi:hypothetical protein